MSWSQRITGALAEQWDRHLWRARYPIEPEDGRVLRYQGREYLNFSSNDYLGISRHPQVIAAWQAGASCYGVGSGGSGHVTGYSDAHYQLETSLAEWSGYDRALVFHSGYSANQAIIHALARKHDHVVADKLSHASLQEAAQRSPATLLRFAHNDMDAAARQLEKSTSGERLLISEGVFSMEGDHGNLPALATLAQKTGSLLMIDDAHGVGVFGPQGRGSCALRQVTPDILVITFGKAFGQCGAAVLCREEMAEYLLQFARGLIYSTLLPAAQAVALHAALDVVRNGQVLRDKLTENIRYFCEGVSSLPVKRLPVNGPIQPLLTGDADQAVRSAMRLRQAGIWLTAMRPPTVPLGQSRLRVTLSAAHCRTDIDRLLETLDVTFRQ